MPFHVTAAGGNPRAASGFSMIELMVVLVILGIVAAAAVPSFTSIINSNRLAAVANELTATLQAARIEASRRGIRVVVCGTTNGTTCTGTPSWGGFLSFDDRNGNGALDAGTERILRTYVLTPPVQMFASSNISANSRIVFRHDGFAYDLNRVNLMAGTLRACIPTRNPVENARDVSLAAGGRVSVARVDTGGIVCAAPANP